MSLTRRVLPRDEWHRLTGALGSCWEQIPASSTVLVVERDGAIVAQWSGHPMFQYLVDGLEIVEPERGNPSVARQLLRAMYEHVQTVGVANILTGAADDATRKLLHKAGAKKAEMDMYSWPVEG